MQRVSNTLAIGQRLELGIGDEQVTWLSTRLEDHAADGTLTVAWPTDHQRQLIGVELGQRLQLSALTPDALLSALVHVHATTHEPLPLLILHLDGAWQRSQRRNALRLGIAVRPRVAARMSGDSNRPVRLDLTNLSATGVQVCSQDELRSGDLLDLAFGLLGVPHEVQVVARVQRVHRQVRDSRSIWDAGCEFVGLSDRLEQRIVQFIFAQQLAASRTRRVLR